MNLTHKTIFKKIQAILGIADTELDVISSQLPDKVIFEYLAHKVAILHNRIEEDSKLAYLESYQNIRDQSWPNLTSIEDFYNLPEHIQSECIEVHKFSPEIYYNPDMTFEDHQPSKDFTYNPDVLTRLNDTVLNNIEFVTNKRVLEFACSYGNMSIVLAKFNPTFLTLAEIRKSTLMIAEEAMSIVKMDRARWQSVEADIHDYKSNTMICHNHDTVFVCGVMYHVHDHFLILESIAKASPTTIIIETEEDITVKDNATPLIRFGTESTDYYLNGYEKNKSEVLIGFPNTAWFDHAMRLLGYQKIKPTRFCKTFNSCPVNPQEAALHIRGIHVYQVAVK